MKKLLLTLGFLSAASGCTNLNDGKSLTEEVTSQPSPAFMKKVAGDPFPAAGAPTKGAASRLNGQSSQGNQITQSSGTIQYGSATTGSATPVTAKNNGTVRR